MSDNRIILKIRAVVQAELGMIYEEQRAEFIHWMTREFHCSMDDSKDVYQREVRET